MKSVRAMAGNASLLALDTPLPIVGGKSRGGATGARPVGRVRRAGHSC